MNSKQSLLRSLAVLGAVALSAPLLAPRTAAAEDGCISGDYPDGSSCWGCKVENCWAVVCYDADFNEYRDGGCSPPPPRIIYA
jgi:hypothetical protein